MNIIKKQAIFIDYENNEQYAEIKINEGMFVEIKTFDANNNQTGYMNIFFHPDKKIYLDTIYCYDQFRNKGIATFISKLADYILKDYEGYVIRGAYEPGQFSTDRKNNIERSQEELERAARKFYEKNGYEIIDYGMYSKTKSKYPDLDDNDFYLGEDGPTTIVAKQLLHQKYSFYEEDGIIYHKNYDKYNIRKK